MHRRIQRVQARLIYMTMNVQVASPDRSHARGRFLQNSKPVHGSNFDSRKGFTLAPFSLSNDSQQALQRGTSEWTFFSVSRGPMQGDAESSIRPFLSEPTSEDEEGSLLGRDEGVAYDQMLHAKQRLLEGLPTHEMDYLQREGHSDWSARSLHSSSSSREAAPDSDHFSYNPISAHDLWSGPSLQATTGSPSTVQRRSFEQDIETIFLTPSTRSVRTPASRKTRHSNARS
jgi:hypothetical protein